MLNQFLTHILEVILVLDVIGLIAYFILAARRSRTLGNSPAPASTMPLAGAGRTSAWDKLTRRGPGLRPVPVRAVGSLDGALHQLRRVLDSYGSSLA